MNGKRGFAKVLNEQISALAKKSSSEPGDSIRIK